MKKSCAPQPDPHEGRKGFTLLILLFAVFLLTIGLMVAAPVWETQIRREMEEELIFRGLQYVEAVRVFESTNPGRYPESLDQLLEENCLRRPFPDPMSEKGEWNVILLPDTLTGTSREERASSRTSRMDDTATGESSDETSGAGQSPTKILIAPVDALESIANPRVIGVVSSSSRPSIKLYYEQASYDRWFFFLGFDPEKLPEIEYYGKERKDNRQ